MRVDIRSARSDDLAPLLGALGEDQHAIFRDRFPDQEARRGQILIAYRDESPVGAVFISWAPADEPEVKKHLAGVPTIFHLFVAPAHRGRGIGRRLLCEAEDRLRLRGHSRVLLGVDRKNSVARRLYLWLGYALPAEPELRNLGHTDKYDILVADLFRTGACWE